MTAPANLCRRFVASTRAVAAIEFSIVLPVLMLIFLGTFDAGRAIAIYMKIRSATFTIDAITNQYTSVQDSDLQSITGAAAVILAPYSSTPAVVTVTQVKVTSANHGIVSWSYSLGGSARSRGAAVTTPGSLGDVRFLSVLPDPWRDELHLHADVRFFHLGCELYSFRQSVCDSAQQQVRAVPDGKRHHLLKATRPIRRRLARGARGRWQNETITSRLPH